MCSILILALFVVWTIVLLLLRAMGTERVGLFSGSMPTRPQPPPTPGGSGKRDGMELAEAIDVVVSVDEVHEDSTDEEILVGGSPEHIALSDTPPTNSSFDTIKKEDESPITAAEAVRVDSADENASVNGLPDTKSIAGSEAADNIPAEDLASDGIYDENHAQMSDRDERENQSENDIKADPSTSLAGEDGQDDEAYVQYKADLKKYNTRLRRTRLSVIAFGVVALISSILMMRKGFWSLISSLNHIGDSLDQAAFIIRNLLNVTEEFLLTQNSTLSTIDNVLRYAPDEWCPDWNTSIPQDISNSTQIHEAQTYLQKAVDAFKPAYMQLLDDLVGFRNDLLEILRIYDNLQQAVGRFKWAHYAAATFVIILDVLILATIVSVGLAWAKKLKKPVRWLHSAFFYTLFLLSLFLIWLFSSIFVLGSIVSSDFCFDSPNPKVGRIMILMDLQNRLGAFTYGMLTYYVSGCDDDVSTYPAQLESYIATLLAALAAMHAFTTKVAAVPLKVLVQYCGAESAFLLPLANAADQQIHVITDSLLTLRELFFCGNIFPIYSGITYNALCYAGVRGLTWLFSTQLVVGISCMSIVTLRAAWDDEEREHKECCRCGKICMYWRRCVPKSSKEKKRGHCAIETA